MCGIVGTIQMEGSVVKGLVDGLRVLEYRGYDSSGIAVARNGTVELEKHAGRLARLEESLADGHLEGARAGIGHTRWATHGPPTDQNAHPHMGSGDELAIVHNGIFENWLELKQELEAEGVRFVSDTDTEVLVHLVERRRAEGEDLATAVRASLARIRGYYAVALLSTGPDGPQLVCARQGPPLAICTTDDGAYLASDVLGLLPYSRDIVFLRDGDIAELTPGAIRITTQSGEPIERASERFEADSEAVGKGDFEHFMLKEIHEQPEVIARTTVDRIRVDTGDFVFEGGAFDDTCARSIARIQIIACGTALHAGWIARYMIEGLAGIPVDVDFASEFRYRNPRLVPDTMVLAISQSGETADTLAAVRLARELGATTAAICNMASSTQVREADQVVLTHAGPEVGVASTKAFVAQVVAAYTIAVRLGRARGTIDQERGKALIADLGALRAQVQTLLAERVTDRVLAVARQHHDAKGFMFLGRGINFPVALEGALKLKEISYMHAEGYPAGEMKHGPIALIEPGMIVVAVSSRGPLAEKVRANIEQVKARGGVVVSVGSDEGSHAISDMSIEVPDTSEWLSPILNTIPLQLLAYDIAHLRGCDIDKPRNLAKSVTVE